MLFEELKDINDKLVYIGDKPEQFKKAVLGLSDDDNHVVYSYNRLVECFMEQNDWDETEAVEWVDYNVMRGLGYMGEYAPMVVYDLEGEDE